RLADAVRARGPAYQPRTRHLDGGRPRFTNRLILERSPYLVQHAHNPVSWWAWGEEPFEEARRTGRPVFLSVGYSTCHWCHVMEHESFENPDIAGLLNADFVSIKVDREERPDVDRVYMSFVQATTGAGGWPMSVFLTPELKPFYGGTYFPPSSRWGRPGFSDLLGEIARVWKDDRPRVEHAATELLERLKGVTGTDGRSRVEAAVAGVDALDVAVEQYQTAFDRRHGGFGNAPKFPRPSELLLLLREHARRVAGGSGPQAPLLMATETLRAMARGGMRDHIGGGFHRYSVDAEWRVPHFEKMLYDQAQLVLAYLEAFQATGDGFFADVAEDTLEYVLRDLTDADGGFYSAEDADSIPPEAAGQSGAHKMEGAFYVWSDEEIGRLLGADADVVRRRFGIEPGGNAPQDPQGEFRGKNLLYASQSVADIATRSGQTSDAIDAILARARVTLFEAREKRPRPHLDDKILTAWNGLMIGALARAARVLVARPSATKYLAAAQRAASFLKGTLWNEQGQRLLRRYRDGEAAIDAYAEDYAFLIHGLLELFQASGEARWLEWAQTVQGRQDALFWDQAEGGWFSTTGQDPTVLLRLKEDYDGAEPAASSVSVTNLITLGNLIGDHTLLAKAEATLSRYGSRIGGAARVIPWMLAALSAWHADHTQVVIVGDRGEATRALHLELARHYLPFSVTVFVEPGESQAAIAGRLPFVGSMTLRDGRATAYVCRDFACRQPVTDPAGLAAEL
ncbi:MAG TPA: thioredoxin domain-containing protein, partial [Vicinamibacterales bacterium]|nr:thioredoxin domain-containing protein [Vicinamibacterales bacterium]